MQLWVELAEIQSTSGLGGPVFTQDKKIFELFEPANVTGVDVRASGYSGGTGEC